MSIAQNAKVPPQAAGFAAPAPEECQTMLDVRAGVDEIGCIAYEFSVWDKTRV